MLRPLAAAALALALCAAAVDPWPWGRTDAPDAGAPPDAASAPAIPAFTGPCAAYEARLARRLAWLAAMREEQFARGGPPDRKKGIPNVAYLYCEAHPLDENCALPAAVVQARSEDLAFNPDAGFDDYEAHVLVMKRELAECRERAASGRPGR